MKDKELFLELNLIKEDEKVKRGKLIGPVTSCRLIYDTKTDGDTPEDFHRCCDKFSGNSVMCKSGVFVAGGYTDRRWSGDVGYKKSSTSFLFSLNRNRKYLVQKENRAIYCNKYWFPCFGCLVIRPFDY